MRELLGSSRGTTMVEFALIVPVLLLLLVGILDLGRALNAYVTMSNASREGARYAMLHPTAAPSAIASEVARRAVPLDSAQLKVTAMYWDGSAFQAWPPPPGSPSPRPVPVRVEACYPWSAFTFLIGQYFPGSSPCPGGSTPGSATFTTASTMGARW